MHAADLLTNRARLSPNRPALLELATGQTYTYAELNRRANRTANFLRHKLGIQKGDRVSLLAYNSVAYVDLLYACLKIGAVFAPLNWRLVANELTYIVNDNLPKALVCGPTFAPVLAEMRPNIDVPHLVSLDGADIPDGVAYEAGLAAASEAEPERPFLTPDDTACILYTSGTTGRPKGAMIPHRQILWNAINTTISWHLTETDCSPIFTPMFHAGGLFVFLTPLFYVGGRIVMAREFDVETSLQTIAREKCTVVLGVPTIFQMWLDSPLSKKLDFSHMRWFISGGAPCPVTLLRAWRERTGVVFRQGYGLTEVGPNCFSMSDEESVNKIGSVGKPIFHSQMRIVDKNGRNLPPGETGELLIAGPHVTTGYWHKPEATTAALRDGWFHTGDMARMDEDGFYYIAGRFKDMIISGGENVYAAEVEAVFLEHPAVAEAALIGQPDEKWGEVGLMIVVLEKGQSATEEELRTFCRQRLAGYKVPRHVIFTDALPYSPYGKVMKEELRRQFLKEQK
ncbi:MAG: long-chain-fatty-acid--CoA ligase [Chloroflexi bacterium]|nr:MAG: long-chain-fatty-acid--CoA ligase [Chloroflexota bacterium]